MGLGKARLVGIELQHWQPALITALIAREGCVNIEDPSEILSALDIAGEPENALRRAGEENVSQEPRYPSIRPPGTS